MIGLETQFWVFFLSGRLWQEYPRQSDTCIFCRANQEWQWRKLSKVLICKLPLSQQEA